MLAPGSVFSNLQQLKLLDLMHLHLTANAALCPPQAANGFAANEFAQRAAVRLGDGDTRQLGGGEEDEGQHLITAAISHDAGFGRVSSPVGFDEMRGDPEAGLGPGIGALSHDAGNGGSAGLSVSVRERPSWGHHRCGFDKNPLKQAML